MNYSTEYDKKWQAIWEKNGFTQFKSSNEKKKLYVLEMFSYPSAANLHVGHWYNYSLSDSWARMKKMQGYNLFQPMGFDAFGLPAENYAIKSGVHPQDSTEANIKIMEQQLKEMGAFFSWDHELVTCREDYYKWTQWLFLQLYHKGLAYRKNAPVNWCPSCQTVLANEQCEDGTCERCHTEILRKHLTQWFFKITDYAQELLDFLPSLDWPDKTKKIQQNWIGRSEGAKVIFDLSSETKKLYAENYSKLLSEKQLDAEKELSSTLETVEVFTTRPDTLMGVTYVVMAPEHPLALLLTTDEQKEKVQAYQEQSAKISEIDRQASGRQASGVFTGSYVHHPLTGERLPLYLGDYVLASYGTGIVMAVPAHDERDYLFATTLQLPIKTVIQAPYTEQTSSKSSEENLCSCCSGENKLPYTEKGILVNSADFNGLTSEEAKEKITSKLALLGKGSKKINYRLRDWLVSRQRYWGAPIPIVYCEKCGMQAVPEKDLPVRLPYDVEFKPDGKSPLAKHEGFLHCTCPVCGGKATRDPDTLDTFVCSSWYYLRYVNPHLKDKAFDTDEVDQMLPVDKYIGGTEHAAMHLLYARFITKALRDMGLLHFDEPFKSLVHQGTILGADGQKMSKSTGNTINPDTYIQEYGSDVFRLYLAFGFSYVEGGAWSDAGVKSIVRFVQRVARLGEILAKLSQNAQMPFPQLDELMKPYICTTKVEKDLYHILHRSIHGVTQDAEKFQFNTSVSRIMELNNALYALLAEKNILEENAESTSEQAKDLPLHLMQIAYLKLLQILAPFAPHFSEELWQQAEQNASIFLSSWPEVDTSALVKDEIEIAVQINSKIVARRMVPSQASSEEVQSQILADSDIMKLVGSRTLVKFIYVQGRIANLILKP